VSSSADSAARDIDYYRDRFHDAGLPLFDEDFSAKTDVFNRAVPLFALVFLAELLGAVQLEWSLAANLLAIAGGIGILIAAIGVINLIRERPFFSAPRSVGNWELAAFILVPALLPLIFGGQTTSAWVTALGNLALVLVIYAGGSYGFVSIVLWVLSRLGNQLRTSFGLLAKAVPMLMIFGLLAFMSEEMWTIFGTETDGGLALIALLFVLLGCGFLFARLPREVRALEEEVDVDGKPLTTRQRRNVGLVLFVSQALQVLTVTLLVALFFVVFGVLAITEPVRTGFFGAEYQTTELVSFTLFGDQYELTTELLRVAGALAAFSGLYFAVAMLTDSTYREEFLDEVTSELRQTFRDRVAYLKLRGESPEAAA
jgi:hypothetical protein